MVVETEQLWVELQVSKKQVTMTPYSSILEAPGNNPPLDSVWVPPDSFYARTQGIFGEKKGQGSSLIRKPHLLKA